MNTHIQLNEIMRLIGNLVRIGTVSELDLPNARCRVTTGSNVTAWLPWMTHRAGRTRALEDANRGALAARLNDMEAENAEMKKLCGRPPH